MVIFKFDIWVGSLHLNPGIILSSLIFYSIIYLSTISFLWLVIISITDVPVYNTGDWIDISVDVFNETQPGSAQQADFKKELWSYELVQVLVLVLKQNFELIPGKWKVAAELATFAR